MIQVYWKNATADVVGADDGVTAADLDAVSPKVEAALDTVRRQADAGELGYVKLPGRTDYRDRVRRLVEAHRPGTTDLVVLGIGGSALGNIALQAALNPATYNLLDQAARGGPRLFVLDNVDPALVADVMDYLGDRLETTLFNVISKSGETAETASQFMIFRQMLRKGLGDEYARHIVATTDAARGTLHTIATAEGYDMLEVPGDVGGRFSVLSEVGLFSAAMCGIDIDALLGGAARMADRCRQADWRSNPACVLAAVKYLMMTAKGKPIHVMMPYSNRLYSLADWYRQLWAESLGKANDRSGREVFVGPTPVKALGATDQHSQVQLYREGPNDKLTVFVSVAAHPADVDIPKAFPDVPGLSYLGGATLGELLAAELAATEYVLAQARRPSVTIRFDAISPAAVGEFLFLYEFATSLMGELLDINAYDQPAVELGKKATFGLLGREGYQDVGEEVRAFAATDERYLV
ncbi:MAG TPA: glucose-6-phosphate isomerase [Phycisphaerae bacterium]|nr:glucose-6-phosphate isomerase [Phycisphaerae bacterium]